MKPRSTIIAFNSVERLLRGDFFHAVTPDHVRGELAAFPAGWGVLGLGTTNWHRRHGEILIEGRAGNPRFLWADPGARRPAAIRELNDEPIDTALVSPCVSEEDGRPHFPFAAVGVWDPVGPARVWELGANDDVQAVIAERCQEANIGLAALRVVGPLRSVEFQAMCDIPLGGVHTGGELVATVEHHAGGVWEVAGFYSANPTIRAMLSHTLAPVHLHGRVETPQKGGHVNRALAAAHTAVEVRPMRDLVLRIHGLDVATIPVRAIA